MPVITHENSHIEWRGRNKEVETRILLNDATGAESLTIWEIFPPKGSGAPPHVHDVEETITVISGRIKAKLDDDIVEAGAGETLYIPAGVGHSFGVISEEKAHLLVVFPVNNAISEYIDWKTWKK